MAPKVKVPMDFGLHLKDSPTHNTLKLNTSNGETVYASSVILSFNSPVIDHMTTTLHMTSVDMLEFSKAAVEVFVDAAYSGKADGINKEVFRDVNKMATVFEMNWLAEKCVAFFNQLAAAAIKKPTYKELVFLLEEAGFVLQTLKLADYIIVIDKKLKSRGGGGVQQQKRSCRREKPKMSFVFFVLFCSFSKHVQNRRFCAEFGQKCVLKKEQKRS